VSVQLEPMAPTALRAPHQDSGMETIVFALKKESGTANNVSVNQDFTDSTVWAARQKNIGMKKLKLVSALLH